MLGVFICVPEKGSEAVAHREKIKATLNQDVKVLDAVSAAECKKEMAMAGLTPDEIEKTLPLMVAGKTLEVVAKCGTVIMGDGWENDELCSKVRCACNTYGISLHHE